MPNGETPGVAEHAEMEETAEELDDALEVLSGDNLHLTDNWAEHAVAAFQEGHRRTVRPVALMTGRELCSHVEDAPATTPAQLTIRGLALGTVAAHKRALSIVVEVPVVFHHLPAARALLLHLQAKCRQRRWRCATMAKNMATIQGALKLLPCYVHAMPVMLADDPEWSQAMRAAQRLAREESPRCPTALTLEEMKRAISEEQNEPVRILLMLSYSTAARIGDCTRLRVNDVNLTNQSLQITWAHGKTVASAGPYSVQVIPPPEWLAAIKQWRATRQSQFFFPKGVGCPAVLGALRRVSPTLECRSIRRGALQGLAAAGVSEEVLLSLSGHASAKTLRRYLMWGKLGLARMEAMSEASKKLFSTVQASGGGATTLTC
jgi:integrase